MVGLTRFLKQADIFYQFSPAQLELVAGLCQEKIYSLGEDIVRESAPTKDLYIIAEGEVDVLVTPALVGGPEAASGMVTIATLREGQSFGEIALVDEGLRSATVRVATRSARLLVISRDKLLEICDTYPDLGYRLMFNLAADLAMKIRNTDFRIRETLLYGKHN
jgi:CRP/FNR family cyclic AMP-dependent transcriptional regulator